MRPHSEAVFNLLEVPESLSPPLGDARRRCPPMCRCCAHTGATLIQWNS